MQKLMPLVAAFAATVMYGCGSPTPPGGGGDRIRIACPGAGADCGVLRIDSDRDNVELTVVRDDAAPGIYQVLKHQAPRAHETWDANLVVEDYPTRYLACAFLSDDEFICRRETLMPGEVKESHCYFEEEQEKAHVRVTADVGGRIKVNDADTGLEAGADVEFPKDGAIHTVTAELATYDAYLINVDTSREVPATINIPQSFHMDRDCTETEGPYFGQTKRVTNRQMDGGYVLDLLEGSHPIVGTDLNEEGVTGGIRDGGRSIDFTVHFDGRDIHTHYDCP